MALLLTDTRDQALVALVVDEATKMKSKGGGGYLGRTALQKVLYFIHARGVETGYRFDLHHYGPFCGEILRDTEWLLADDVIRDASSDTSRYSSYAPGPNIDEMLHLHREFVEESRRVVQSVLKALWPLEPDRMEMFATLDYITRELAAARAANVSRGEVVQRFRDVKGTKFRKEDVEKALESLRVLVPQPN